MTANTQLLKVQDWGLMEYRQALESQELLVDKRFNGHSPNILVLVEHPPVVSVGRSGNENDLCLPKSVFRQKGIDLHFSDHGGKATYHGPGQMVAYPIIEILNRDLHWYVRTLLEVVASVLREYGLEPAFKGGNPGIWVNGKKITSIGVAVKKWITYHGVALNVNPELSAFDWIVPCGHPDEIMTSMENELDQAIELVLSALLQTGCRYLTMGQYLAPSKAHVPVDRYVQPYEFDQWAEKANVMGFKEVASGPLIRSSYKAEEMNCIK